jgi:integrase/recombinase XerC
LLAFFSRCKASLTIWLRAELRDALVALQAVLNPDPDDHIIHSERDAGMSPGAVQVWFHRLYQDLGFAGASSHSGRRTFITRTAKKIVEAGGSLRDVQELAGHTSLSTTQRYIQGDTVGQAARGRSVVDPQHPFLSARPRRAGFLTAK